MRIFIALPVSAQVEQALTQAQAQMRAQSIQAKYVPEENFHITLAFIGEVESIEPVKEILRSIPVPAMQLELDGWGHFHDLYYAALKNNAGKEALYAYVKTLQSALAKAGIMKENRNFKAHITLARKVKVPQNFVLDIEALPFTPEKVVLFESRLQAPAPVYIPLFSVKAR